MFATYALSPRAYRVDPSNWLDPTGGIWAVTPRVVFGWTDFPADVARWRLDGG
jgi:hypothetical protein